MASLPPGVFSVPSLAPDDEAGDEDTAMERRRKRRSSSLGKDGLVERKALSSEDDGVTPLSTLSAWRADPLRSAGDCSVSESEGLSSKAHADAGRSAAGLLALPAQALAAARPSLSSSHVSISMDTDDDAPWSFGGNTSLDDGDELSGPAPRPDEESLSALYDESSCSESDPAAALKADVAREAQPVPRRRHHHEHRRRAQRPASKERVGAPAASPAGGAGSAPLPIGAPSVPPRSTPVRSSSLTGSAGKPGLATGPVAHSPRTPPARRSVHRPRGPKLAATRFACELFTHPPPDARRVPVSLHIAEAGLVCEHGDGRTQVLDYALIKEFETQSDPGVFICVYVAASEGGHAARKAEEVLVRFLAPDSYAAIFNTVLEYVAFLAKQIEARASRQSASRAALPGGPAVSPQAAAPPLHGAAACSAASSSQDDEG